MVEHFLLYLLGVNMFNIAFTGDIAFSKYFKDSYVKKRFDR